jgi:hypothetical protein
VELDEEFRLAAVLGAIASTAEHENHGVGTLQLGKLAALRGVIGELVIGKECTRDYIGSHDMEASFCCAVQRPFEDIDCNWGSTMFIFRRATETQKGRTGRPFVCFVAGQIRLAARLLL